MKHNLYSVVILKFLMASCWWPNLALPTETATHRVWSRVKLGEALIHRTSFVPFVRHFGPQCDVQKASKQRDAMPVPWSGRPFYKITLIIDSN
jgi:hypothetical protein